MRILSIAALFLVAGCSQQDQAAAPATNEAAVAPESPVERPAVPALKGEWRVTSIAATPSASAMTVAIGDKQASVSVGCLRRAWTYTQDRNSVAFTSSPGGSSNCGRSPSGEEETAFTALDDANLAIFGKDGGDVTLSGPGGTLSLERR